MSPEEYRAAAAVELAKQGTTRMPPTSQQWLSPVGVRAVRDGIEWLPRESFDRDGVIVPSDGLLEDFLVLRDATPDQVSDFAARHGVLGVFGERQWHQPGEYQHEPLSLWQDAANRANALLTAAARLRAGQPLTDEQRIPVLQAAWPDVTPDMYIPRELYLDGEPFYERHTDSHAALTEALLAHASRTLEDDRTQLAWAVSTWMQEAGAQLVLTWPAGATAPTLTIGGARPRGCLQGITVQVALACSRAETARPCDGCGGLHAPRRQPKPGQRSFCHACRDAGVPVKLANRDRRARRGHHSEKGGA